MTDIKKLTLVFAIILMFAAPFLTSIYIPQGYTAVSGNDHTYSRGLHLLQTHPFEYTQLIKTGLQCDSYEVLVMTSEGHNVKMIMDVCWRVERNASKIDRLNEVFGGDKEKISANINQDYIKSIYEFVDSDRAEMFYGERYKNYAYSLMYPKMSLYTIQEFSDWNLSDIVLSDNYTEASQNVSAKFSNQLLNEGIEVDFFRLSLADNTKNNQARINMINQKTIVYLVNYKGMLLSYEQAEGFANQTEEIGKLKTEVMNNVSIMEGFANQTEEIERSIMN